MQVTYHELEKRYGEAVAQFLVKEIERAAKIGANDNDVDYARRLARAQHIQDQQQ
jgi:hypothetical protein